MQRLLLAVMLLLLGGIAGTAWGEDAQLAAGISEFQQGNYEEAVDILQKFRSREPAQALPALYLGLAQQQIGDEESAVESLRTALTLTPPAKEGVISLVEILLSREELDEAAKWIAWGEKEQVAPADIAYLKGSLLEKQGDDDGAVVAYNAAIRANPAFTQMASLQVAAIKAKDYQTDEALKSLQAVITSNPTSELAGFARDYEKKLLSREGFKKLQVFAGVSYQYDDNVVLEPSETVSGLQFPGRRDHNFVQNLLLQYNAPLNGRLQFSGQYNIYNNAYFELNEFNQTSQTLTLIPSYRRQTVNFSLPVSAGQIVLDSSNYLMTVSAKPTATLVFSPTHFGQIGVGYLRKEFIQEPQSSDENRDADLFSGLLGYIHFFADNKGMFSLRYEALSEDAKGNNWANIASRLTGELLLPLASRTKLILGGEGLWQNYRFIHSAYGVKRNDKIYSATLALNQELVERLFLNLQYNHTSAKSNIPIYDYSRNVVSLGVEYRY